MDNNIKTDLVFIGIYILLINFWFWTFIEMFFGIIGLPKYTVINIIMWSFFAPFIYIFVLAFYNSLKGY